MRATSAPILRVCEQIADEGQRCGERGHIPLVLGGDHSIAMGTLGGMAKARGPGAALWIDAHGDLNRPGNLADRQRPRHAARCRARRRRAGLRQCDAYPVPSVTRAALVGVRSLDQGERELIRELDVRVFTMSEIDSLGVERVMREALAYLAGAPFLHVSLDLDAVDPMFAPGVGTPVRGGLSYREAHLALELVSESGLLDSLDVVEVNPILDRENETGKLAVELVASALGARIL